MSDIRNIHDLAGLVGYESLDREFLSWLESDSNLREEALGVLRKKEPQAFVTDRMKALAAEDEDWKQFIHRLKHPNGPYGCGVLRVLQMNDEWEHFKDTWAAWDKPVNLEHVNTEMFRQGWPAPTIYREHEAIHILSNALDKAREEIERLKAEREV